jgi:O-antigen/teichoic acid export membrane protein
MAGPDQRAEATQPTSAQDVAARTGGKALLAGGTMLAVAMTAANAGNYLLNLVLGRWLTPAEFADANLMVTLMLLVTAIAVALQLISARFASIHQARGTDERAEAVAARLRKVALISGFGLMVLLAAPAAWWSEVFNTESSWPFVILAAGMPCYLLQAVGRGLVQGRLRFGALAMTFVLEMVVRLAAGLGLVAAGMGVEGATLGLTLSFVATWLIVRRAQPSVAAEAMQADEKTALRVYALPVIVLLIGQIVINNGDVLVVKAFFSGERAGVYSAIALIGRAVFFLSWSAVTTLFPAVAQRDESGQGSNDLLLMGVGVVGGACAVMTGAIAVGGDRFFTGVFGPEYAGVQNLLVQYAIATSFFAVANLIVTYHLSANRAIESRLLVAGAVLQTVLLLTNHDSLSAVLADQLIAMGVLLVAVVSSTLLLRPRPAPGATATNLTAAAVPSTGGVHDA